MNGSQSDGQYPHPFGPGVVEEFADLLGGTLRPRLRRDFPAWILKAPFVEANRGRFMLRFMPKWQEWATTEAQRIGIDTSSVLAGEAGWNQLTQLYDALRVQLRQIADRRSAFSWLVITRRINPADLLPAARASISEAVLSFALSEVGSSRRPSKSAELITSRWWLAPQALTDLDELCSVGMLLFNVHSARRRVAKGQSLRLEGAHLVPEVVDTDDTVERAISLYDGRLKFTGGRGNDLGSFPRTVTDRRESANIITWADLRGQDLVSRDDLTRLLQTYGPVFPLGTNIEDLAPAAFSSGVGLTLETQAATAVLSAAWTYLADRGATWKSVPGDWSQYGYLRCPRDWFTARLKDGPALPELLGSSWREGATVREVITLLVRAQVVLPVGRHVVVDLTRASSLLMDSFERAKEGAAANEWGSSFEAAVQEAIDTTPWKPTSALRSVIGKKVKDENGNVITDIDAVAFHAGTLWLISAKAFQAGPDYTVGAYDAVKRIARKAVAASEQWNGYLERIRWRPSALGVDLPDGCTLEGLVVMPFVPYVPIESSAAKPVGDLCHVSSIHELITVALRA
ncbi:hypothetical protein GT021_42515 [Streptomyces sp. SID5470]|uniref:Uncharacterized protein n=1 Tax=Streptomyces sviceus (strain ATCC 29083 / DSM 924 / JCM 4929 / NBRC 13980 / NCIMB 11184 / NRRL 5439 / UC 5370) TaxID=463191 RepID=B5I7A3_STRX2|nr:hypothetical protein [Streptomyces sp. CC0208]EDY60958.1 conserved hypothetical protein [Streptomyces sviceus ATCC 29083]MYT10842.1 hypothetical protein [Streptomyces sp. SID5470]